VKKIGKFFAYLLFFIFALMLFMPKESLYYLAEEQLKEFSVVITDESLVDSFISLEVKTLDLSLKGVESAYADSLSFTLLGLYNSVSVEEIKLSSVVEVYLPSKIKTLNVEYSIFHPLSIRANSIGEFGEVKAEFDLVDLSLNAHLKPSKLMLKKYKNSLRFFKKSKEGEYLYAKNI